MPIFSCTLLKELGWYTFEYMRSSTFELVLRNRNSPKVFYAKKVIEVTTAIQNTEIPEIQEVESASYKHGRDVQNLKASSSEKINMTASVFF